MEGTSQPSLSGINIHESQMEVSTLPLAGDSASSGAQPSNPAVIGRVTLCLPGRPSPVVVTWMTEFLQRHARGSWCHWRGSTVMEASLSLDISVLTEIVELVKKCCSVENGFTFQIATWGIFHHNGDSVYLFIFKVGDVPVNIETKWNIKRTGITMSGLFLNGAQLKATTECTNTTLKSGGSLFKGCGLFDELHFPIEGSKGIEESFIYAAKIVEFDGMSFVARSDASYVGPQKAFLEEIVQDEFQKIPTLAMKMKSLAMKVKLVLESILGLKTKHQYIVLRC